MPPPLSERQQLKHDLAELLVPLGALPEERRASRLARSVASGGSVSPAKPRAWSAHLWTCWRGGRLSRPIARAVPDRAQQAASRGRRAPLMAGQAHAPA
jgi:hypothetical protein